ncbi:MAG: saccharopine dehydrogenase family protein, partial [Planctomycetaceae bacterium]|nr:saccharopine dehydrogenase family protein [Planctomycetaceae bacterium]
HRLKPAVKINTARIDADNVPELVALIKDVKPDLVMNIALPYQDLTIMEACLQTGTHYLDTANYEHPDTAKFEYAQQWAYHNRFKAAGITALLGSGFDPGQTNVYVAYAKKHRFERIVTVDILDCNGGDHGYPFATNFNPEINIREVSAKGRYYENGKWNETEPLSVKKVFDFDEVGKKEMYLLYHEEMESLVKYFPEVKRMRFWMTFGQSYLTHLKVLENVGMTRIDPVLFSRPGLPDVEIVPLQFLKTLLPDPASLGPRTKGKTNIGVWVTGVSREGTANYYIYNVCDHQQCYAETGAQAVSYTTGVPAALGAKMILTGAWSGAGVFNMEQFDPDPFMREIGDWGLPWKETFPATAEF